MENKNLPIKESPQQVALSTQLQHSKNLVQCIAMMGMEQPEARTKAKLELTTISRQLMPGGHPSFREMRYYLSIPYLIKSGEVQEIDIATVLFILVKDLCSSVNVVRNMNEDQMIEAASMLLNECDDFRLEDFVMMFTLAKRGELIKIMDRLDINIISQMLDVYYSMRWRAGQKYQAEEHQFNERPKPPRTPEEKEMSDRFGQLVGIMRSWEKAGNDPDSVNKKELQKIKPFAEANNIDWGVLVKQFPHRRKEKVSGQLQKLKAQFDNGFLSEIEYKQAKEKLLKL